MQRIPVTFQVLGIMQYYRMFTRKGKELNKLSKIKQDVCNFLANTSSQLLI